MAYGLSLTVALTFVVTAVGAADSGRIVGGENSKVAQFPYQVSLRIFNGHICGGSIISTRFILTAAHCVVLEGNEPYDAKYFNVRVGSHNRLAGGVLVRVKRIIVHQDYRKVLNDVALLELEEELVYSQKIQPIALETQEVPAGSSIVISGWGLLQDSGVSSPIILQWNNVTAMNSKQCRKRIRKPSKFFICLNHPAGDGVCNGDSGGPAVYNGKLVGVAGFVIGDCGLSNPDVYAKVSYHVEWIRKHMQ